MQRRLGRTPARRAAWLTWARGRPECRRWGWATRSPPATTASGRCQSWCHTWSARQGWVGRCSCRSSKKQTITRERRKNLGSGNHTSNWQCLREHLLETTAPEPARQILCRICTKRPMQPWNSIHFFLHLLNKRHTTSCFMKSLNRSLEVLWRWVNLAHHTNISNSHSCAWSS